MVGVGAVIFDQQREKILLVKRGHPPAKGYWSIPGGLVERGETLRQACQREIVEETGLQIEPREQVAVLERVIGAASAPDYHFIIIDFWAQLGQQQTACAGSDVVEVRWVGRDQLAALQTTAGLGDVVAHAFDVASGVRHDALFAVLLDEPSSA